MPPKRNYNYKQNLTVQPILSRLEVIQRYRVNACFKTPDLRYIEMQIALKPKNVHEGDVVKICNLVDSIFGRNPLLYTRSYNQVELRKSPLSKKDSAPAEVRKFFLKDIFDDKDELKEITSIFPANTIETPYEFKSSIRDSLAKNNEEIKRKFWTAKTKIPLSRWIDCSKSQKEYDILSVDLRDLAIEIEFKISTESLDDLEVNRLGLEILKSVGVQTTPKKLEIE